VEDDPLARIDQRGHRANYVFTVVEWLWWSGSGKLPGCGWILPCAAAAIRRRHPIGETQSATGCH
jgi:hypothetical protein